MLCHDAMSPGQGAIQLQLVSGCQGRRRGTTPQHSRSSRHHWVGLLPAAAAATPVGGNCHMISVLTEMSSSRSPLRKVDFDVAPTVAQMGPNRWLKQANLDNNVSRPVAAMILRCRQRACRRGRHHRAPLETNTQQPTKAAFSNNLVSRGLATCTFAMSSSRRCQWRAATPPDTNRPAKRDPPEMRLHSRKSIVQNGQGYALDFMSLRAFKGVEV